MHFSRTTPLRWIEPLLLTPTTWLVLRRYHLRMGHLTATGDGFDRDRDFYARGWEMEYLRCAGLREGHRGQQVCHPSIFLNLDPSESDTAENGFILQGSQASRGRLCRLSDVFIPQCFFGGTFTLNTA